MYIFGCAEKFSSYKTDASPLLPSLIVAVSISFFSYHRLTKTYKAIMESTSIVQSLPPLLLLPLEIKFQIASYLSPRPLTALRLTHTVFARSISRADVRRCRLVWMESGYSHNFPRSQYACYTCLKLLPAHSFCDDSKTGKKCTGGLLMEKRFCLDCGVEKGRYLRNAAVVIRGGPRVPCQQCGHSFFGRLDEICTPGCPEFAQRRDAKNR